MTINYSKCGVLADEQDLICSNCNELIIVDSAKKEGYTCSVCGAVNELGSKSCAFCCSIIT